MNKIESYDLEEIIKRLREEVKKLKDEVWNVRKENDRLNEYIQILEMEKNK
jgi:septal ring factor EnvC (AmiA/AmiB activator)